MLQLLQESILLVNLPFTALLGLSLVYWGFVIVGALDMDSLDVDVGGPDVAGPDLDVAGPDLDAPELDAPDAAAPDLDAPDGHGGGGIGGGGGSGAAGALAGSSGILVSALRYFNVGEVPLMIVLSFVFLSAWTTSILFNYHTGNRNVWIGWAMGVPHVVAGLFVAKFVTLPFRAVFRRLDTRDAERERIVGRSCVIRSGVADAESGHAEIETDGAPHLINVRTRDGVPMKKGQIGIVYRHDAARGIYMVEPIEAVERTPNPVRNPIRRQNS